MHFALLDQVSEDLGSSIVVLHLAFQLRDLGQHELVLVELRLDLVLLLGLLLSFLQDLGLGASSLGAHLQHVGTDSLGEL